MRRVARFSCLLWLALPLALAAGSESKKWQRPNIILILTDDLGYGHLGSYGQEKIRTPELDALAADGMRFTQAYSGSHSCYPARAALLTGLHTGHTSVRAGGGGKHLLEEDVTLAEVLRRAGYVTGAFGKWGLGLQGASPGHPNRQGVDYFFGYLNHIHAHYYYPYNRDRRFFCYLAYTIPHVPLTVPEASVEPYRGAFDEEAGWGTDEPYATFAGMISRMDEDVGELVDLLEKLDIDERTLILFTSDNGPQGRGYQRLLEFFDGNGPLQGYKAQLYEGGIRVPAIAWWPGHVPSGRVSDHPWYFPDVMPTLAELAGAEPPETDGISIVPTLLGEEAAGRPQRKHELLYWNRYENAYRRPDRPERYHEAVRMGRWKAVQPAPGEPFELYDIEADPGETTDVADEHPDVMEQVRGHLETARTERHPWEPPAYRPGEDAYVR